MGLFSSGKSQLKRLKQIAADKEQRFGTGKTGQPPLQSLIQSGQNVEQNLQLPSRGDQGRPFTQPHAETLDLSRLLKAIQGQMGAPFQPAEQLSEAGAPGQGRGEGQPGGLDDIMGVLSMLSAQEEQGQQGQQGFGGGGGGGGNILQQMLQLQGDYA